MIDNIISLAKESSPEKRHRVVEHVIDLFVSGSDSYQTEEITLFNTVLENMLPKMDPEQKINVAERLASVDVASHDVAMSLARDQIDVARPMLTQSNALKSEDILQLAKTMGQGHLLAISKRGHLESKVTDVLLERGESPVKQSVAANSGAEMSDWGSRLLLKLAERDDKIRDAMMERSDVSTAEYDKLIEQLPPEQKTRVRKLRDENEALVMDLFHEASKVVASTRMQRKATRIDVKGTLKEIRAGQRSLGKSITQLALSNNLLDICFLLAEFSDVDQKYITNVMVRYDATGIAILCRALGVDNKDYSVLCKARATNNKQPQTTLDKWLSDYQSLNDRDARRLLSFMKIRLNSLQQPAA